MKPPPTATSEVTVIITDVNDETPKFRSGHYECEIAENAPVNTPLTFLGSAMPEVYDHDQVNYHHCYKSVSITNFRELTVRFNCT